MCFESRWFPYFTSLQGFFLAWIICTILRMTRRACLSWFTSPWLPIYFSELVLEHWEGKNWPLCSAAFLPSDHPTTSACGAWGPGKYLERNQNPNPNASKCHASPCISILEVLTFFWGKHKGAATGTAKGPKGPKGFKALSACRTWRCQRSQETDMEEERRRGDGSCQWILPFAVIAVSRPLAAQARQHERVHPQLQHPLRSEGLAKSYHPYAANHLFDQTVLENKLSLPLNGAFPLHYSITAAPHSFLATFMILYRCVRTTMYILLAW